LRTALSDRNGGSAGFFNSLLGFRAKSAHEKDNQADQQNQTKPAAADGRPANIKTAAAEQKKKDNE
jgi:hypothetical protein